MNILLKIKHLLQRLVICCREYPKDCHEFGHKVAWVKFWDVLIPTGKSKKYIDTLSKRMHRELEDLINQYCTPTASGQKESMNKAPLWVCWWQGEEAMPGIVRQCYRAMQKQVPERVETILITEENYSQFASIPEHIVEKYRSGIISAAHFSDVLRFCLLSQHGGMWLDATVFVSGPIPGGLFSQKYYTQKVEDPFAYPKEPSRAQWCGFIWAGLPGNPLFCFVRDALFLYWKKHNVAMDYIFFDYIILDAYNHLPYIREMMDRQKPNNENIWALWQSMNQKYDMDACTKLFQDNFLHKLSYKGDLKRYTPEGELTTYGWLMGEGYEN